jgi:hypothetical protein
VSETVAPTFFLQLAGDTARKCKGKVTFTPIPQKNAKFKLATPGSLFGALLIDPLVFESNFSATMSGAPAVAENSDLEANGKNICQYLFPFGKKAPYKQVKLKNGKSSNFLVLFSVFGHGSRK